MAGDARAAAEQQLVALEGRGAVEVGVAGTGLTEQVLDNEAAQIHRLLVLTEPLHQLFAANTDDAGRHHRLDRGQRGATVEAGGIVASKLALEREPSDVFPVIADAIRYILEAPLGDEAEPSCDSRSASMSILFFPNFCSIVSGCLAAKLLNFLRKRS